MSEFSEKMGMAAGNNFKSGYNCCEAIVQTFRKEAGVNIDDNAFRLCSGFGAALAMRAIVRSYGRLCDGHQYVGRPQSAERGSRWSEIYPLTLEFHERFAKEFGSCACGDLMPYEFNTREHLKKLPEAGE